MSKSNMIYLLERGKSTQCCNRLDLRPFKFNERTVKVLSNYTLRKSWGERKQATSSTLPDYAGALVLFCLLLSLWSPSGAGSSQMLIFSFAFPIEQNGQFYSPISSSYTQAPTTVLRVLWTCESKPFIHPHATAVKIGHLKQWHLAVLQKDVTWCYRQ